MNRIYHDMNEDPPEFESNHTYYAGHGETCITNTSYPLMVKIFGREEVEARFECYIWLDEDEFIEPVYAWLIEGEQIPIGLYDSWTYKDEQLEKRQYYEPDDKEI